jgi:cytochrome P450
MLSGIKKMKQFLKLQFEEAEQKPRSGLISELIAIQKEGEQLSEDELMAMVFMLFVAGHETTVHLISNCIVTFAQFPKALNALMSDWNRADMAIEEVLRYCSPVQFGKPRFVTTNTEFFGQDLKRGQMILPLLASANYDPEKFFDPEVFDIERSPNYHLTFGSGPHTCLGIKLARAETSHALKALYTRWPDFRMLFDVNKIDWSNRPGMRGIRSLPVS